MKYLKILGFLALSIFAFGANNSAIAESKSLIAYNEKNIHLHCKSITQPFVLTAENRYNVTTEVCWMNLTLKSKYSGETRDYTKACFIDFRSNRCEIFSGYVSDLIREYNFRQDANLDPYEYHVAEAKTAPHQVTSFSDGQCSTREECLALETVYFDNEDLVNYSEPCRRVTHRAYINNNDGQGVVERKDYLWSVKAGNEIGRATAVYRFKCVD